MKISKQKITSSVDTGLHYWYKFKHGLGPGTMPSDCHLLKVVEDGWKDYVLLDRMLTTEELNQYEIKEEEPSDELLAENGITDKYMQGEVTGSEDIEDSQFDDKWDSTFGEPSTEVFTLQEFEDWWEEVIQFE